MRADDLARLARAVDADRDSVAGAADGDAFGIEPDRNPFGFEDFANRVGHLVVLAADEMRAHLDHGDLAAEAAIHLRELEPDVAAADDDEMARQDVDVHHRYVVEIGYVRDTGDRRHGGAPADVDEDLRRLEQSRRRPAPNAAPRSAHGPR